jgi:hypothetical protein
MDWLGRWFGRRQAPAVAPWSFPCRLVLSDALAMTVFAHDVQTLGPTLACWTFVSDGLIG